MATYGASMRAAEEISRNGHFFVHSKVVLAQGVAAEEQGNRPVWVSWSCVYGVMAMNRGTRFDSIKTKQHKIEPFFFLLSARKHTLSRGLSPAVYRAAPSTSAAATPASLWTGRSEVCTTGFALSVIVSSFINTSGQHVRIQQQQCDPPWSSIHTRQQCPVTVTGPADLCWIRRSRGVRACRSDD